MNEYMFMAYFGHLTIKNLKKIKNRIFLFTIFLILTIPTTTVLLRDNQTTFTNNESIAEEFEKQVPRESAIPIITDAPDDIVMEIGTEQQQ